MLNRAVRRKIFGAPVARAVGMTIKVGVAQMSTYSKYTQILPSDSIPDVVTKMLENGQPRAFMVFNDVTGKFEASHPMLNEVAQSVIEDQRDYDNHEAIFLEVGRDSRALHSVFLHNTTRGPGAGGARCTHYRAMEDYVKDGLRLSQSMSHKAALAGVWWGGGGSLVSLPDPRHTTAATTAPAASAVAAATAADRTADRTALFRDHARFVTSLQGCFITGKDLGVVAADMEVVHRYTRFLMNAPPAVGGSGESSSYTGRGVVAAADTAARRAGLPGLRGLSLAVMGAGRVAQSVVAAALEAGISHVVMADPNAEAVAAARALFTDGRVEVRHVHRTDVSILSEPVDVLAPCATGGVLNPMTIPAVKARFVVGGANNTLLDPARDAVLLANRGVTVVPDFVCNRMALIVAAAETEGHLINDPLLLRHLDAGYEDGIAATTQRVLARAEAEGVTTTYAARLLAGEALQQPHPLSPNRARNIVLSLVQQGWVNNY